MHGMYKKIGLCISLKARVTQLVDTKYEAGNHLINKYYRQCIKGDWKKIKQRKVAGNRPHFPHRNFRLGK